MAMTAHTRRELAGAYREEGRIEARLQEAEGRGASGIAKARELRSQLKAAQGKTRFWERQAHAEERGR